MKALSIHQPWAWLIANGIKTVENRTWKTNFRGQFLIHASTSPMTKEEEKFISNMAIELARKGIDLPIYFQRGGIVGVAEIVECFSDFNGLPASDNISINDLEWYISGHYGFVIRNAKPLKFYPLRGHLSFFDTNIELEDFV